MTAIHTVSPAPAQGADFTAFLKPESMMTPGVAGTTTMMFTNAVCGAFPMLSLRPTAFVISALFGAVVLVSSMTLGRRLIFFAINTLFIFCMAVGTAKLSYGDVMQKVSWLDLGLVTSAQAQQAQAGEYIAELTRIINTPGLSAAEREQQIAALNARAQQEGWQLPGLPAEPHKVAQDGFFKDW
jgi:hypothetical protein